MTNEAVIHDHLEEKAFSKCVFRRRTCTRMRDGHQRTKLIATAGVTLGEELCPTPSTLAPSSTPILDRQLYSTAGANATESREESRCVDAVDTPRASVGDPVTLRPDSWRYTASSAMTHLRVT